MAFSFSLTTQFGGSILANNRQPERHSDSDGLVKNVPANFEKAIRGRRLQKALKGKRRNLEPKPPRKKDWTRESYDSWDDSNLDQRERIMPIDERDRRRSLEQAAFKDPGAQPVPKKRAPVAPDGPGTVVSVSSGLCVVELAGTRLQCRIRSKLTAAETSFTNVVAVGDEVRVSDDGSGGGIIEEVLPRRTVLARPDVFHSHRRQVIVANSDQLLIVSSWREPQFWPELVDRCIITAQRGGLMPIVCVNKIDLAEDAVELEDALQPYETLGHRIIKTSVVTGEGVTELRDLLRDKTTALTGMSGTGKSSLISAAQPGLDLRTAQVSSSRKRQGEGRHTTTQVTMLSLEAGGFVVDTPGVREFGLSGLRRHELASFYPEISALAPRCRFNNCAHLEEPGCAVRAGKENGAVHASRYHTYKAILGTLPE